MIINKNYYPCLWFEHEDSYRLWYKSEWGSEVGTSVDSLDHQDKNLYLIDFFGYGVFKHWNIKDFISRDILDRIKNKELYLLLNCPGHGPHHLAAEIYEDVIIKLNLDPRQVIISSESLDLDEAVKYVAASYNMLPCITQVVLYYQHSCTVQAITGQQKQNYFKFEYKPYNKKFLSFNGHKREHRTALVYGLASLDLLDKGLISFNAKTPDDNTELTFWHIISTCRDDTLKKLYESNKDKLRQLTHITLDDMSGKDIAGFMPEHGYYQNQTYFSIITETNFETFLHNHEEKRGPVESIGKVYSEKIFRTVLYQHPFIAVAPKHFLKSLREMGYKTFNGIIDESYDEEENYSTRIYKICKEVERLCNFSEKEVYDFLGQTANICGYNHNVLKNKRDFKKILIT